MDDLIDFVQDKLAAETDAYRRTLADHPQSSVMTWDKGYMAGYIAAMEQVEKQALHLSDPGLSHYSQLVERGAAYNQ